MEPLSVLSTLHRRRLTTPAVDGWLEFLKEEWILLGPHGAVNLLAWHYPEGSERAEHCRRIPEIYIMKPGDGAYWAISIGFHSPRPGCHDEDDTPSRNCHILEGPCHADSNGWDAIQLIDTWRDSGFDDEVIYGGLLVEYIAQFLSKADANG